MKKLIKILLSIIVIVFLLLAIFIYTKNEKLPIGTQGQEADILANKMLTALNFEAYKNTRYLEWSFRNKHFYKWDKVQNIVTITWDNYKVLIHTKQQKNSKVFINQKLTDNPEILKKAINYFNNDSFWLVAPYKIFDKGIKRSIIDYDNQKALLVTYTSGGSTPGDSYLWILDKNGMPISYKMWVSIIPIGGIEASWNEWVKTKSGALLPSTHKLPIGTLDMGNVKGYN
ncbi:hypothetical protein [Tenacibaculum sp. 190524A02b]|uniref:hypothetical protein n=1 Tax=Tenacibaculum vairaonense TaxID=3137860 RepID=UPI0031FB6592